MVVGFTTICAISGEFEVSIGPCLDFWWGEGVQLKLEIQSEPLLKFKQIPAMSCIFCEIKAWLVST
jgi:hypothetical protein